MVPLMGSGAECHVCRSSAVSTGPDAIVSNGIAECLLLDLHVSVVGI